MKNLRLRLTVFNFLEFAVWGSYLVSLGNYLGRAGMGEQIFWFYTVQGIVSLFMPMIVSHVADRYRSSRNVLGVCHLLSALFKFGAVAYCLASPQPRFWPLFALFGVSVAFYIPTIGVGNAMAFGLLRASGHDTVKAFPTIRVFGTVGFITAMLMVNFIRFDGVQLQASSLQLAMSGIFGLVAAAFVMTLPRLARERAAEPSQTKVSYLSLLKNRRVAVILLFTFLLGVCLQITNSYGNLYITSFGDIAEYAHTWSARNANAILFVSQVSETLCILLIPFCLKWFGIKKVIIMSAVCWMLRFAFLGAGDTGSGLPFLIMSMIVYGVAFDFINIAGAIYLDRQAPASAKNRVQGLFMLVMSGLGATIGTPLAGLVVNHLVMGREAGLERLEGWQMSWYVFAAYALVVALLVWLIFPAEKGSQQSERVGKGVA